MERLRARPRRVERGLHPRQQERLHALLASNRRVSLALGLHYSPDWVFDRPRQPLRRRPRADLRATQRRVQPGRPGRGGAIHGSRSRPTWASTTSGPSGSPQVDLAEVLYPEGGSYWAFDANALGGAVLPPSLRPNPLPGWRPGGTDVPVSAVANWADWYVSALADVVDLADEDVGDLGFTGYFEVLTPGSGVRPPRTAAVDNHLPPWPTWSGSRLGPTYAALPGPECRGLCVVGGRPLGGDDSCTARQTGRRPRRSGCRALVGDPLDQPVRGRVRLRQAGGEPRLRRVVTLGGHYRDASADGMMAAAVRQSRDCGFQGLYWAHDEQLCATVPLVPRG